MVLLSSDRLLWSYWHAWILEVLLMVVLLESFLLIDCIDISYLPIECLDPQGCSVSIEFLVTPIIALLFLISQPILFSGCIFGDFCLCWICSSVLMGLYMITSFPLNWICFFFLSDDFEIAYYVYFWFECFSVVLL